MNAPSKTENPFNIDIPKLMDWLHKANREDDAQIFKARSWRRANRKGNDDKRNPRQTRTRLAKTRPALDE